MAIAKGAIELIPKEVAAAKRRGKFSRRFWAFSLSFLILSGAASAGLFFLKQREISRLKDTEENGARLEADISQFAEVEKKALALEAKSLVIPRILSERDYFSIVLSSVEKSRPSGLTVTGLIMAKDESELMITGKTSSYQKLASFLDNLVNQEKGGALFAQAGLTLVSLDASSGEASFAIDAEMKKGGLRKPLPGKEDK